MVNLKRKSLLALISCSLAAFSGGCSVMQQLGWNQAAPKPRVLQLGSTSSSSGSSCDPASSIWTGSLSEAQTTLDCIANQVDQAWDSVKGATPDVLTRDELVTLLQSGAVQLPLNPQELVTNIDSLLEFFGAPGELKRTDTRGWMQWARQNLDTFRGIYYSLFYPANTPGPWSDPAWKDASRLALSFMSRVHWSEQFDWTHLEEVIQALLEPKSDATWNFMRSGRDLLGVQIEGPLAPQIINRVQWMYNSWDQGHTLYAHFQAGLQPFLYSDVDSASELLTSGLSVLNVSLSETDFAAHLQSFFGFTDPHVVQSIYPATRLVHNLLNMVCPIQDPAQIRTMEIGTCLANVPNAFRGAQTYLEFALNKKIAPASANAIQTLHSSLAQLETAADTWLEQPGIKPIQTQLLFDFAQNFGAQPPQDFMDSFAMVTQFDPKSTATLVGPGFFERLVHILRTDQDNLIDGSAYFLTALSNSQCQNAATSWLDCILKDSATLQTQAPAVSDALSLVDQNYAQNLLPFNGDRFQRIMYFEGISQEIIRAFGGSATGSISANGSDNKDNVVQTLTLGLGAYDMFQRLWQNLMRKINGQLVIDELPKSGFFKLNFNGLSQVLTLVGSDVLARLPDTRNGIEKVVTGVLTGLVGSGSSLSLNARGLTAIFTLVDSLGALQTEYAHEIEPRTVLMSNDMLHDSGVRFSKDHAIQAISQILKTNFPRTYQSCLDFGFAQSCEVVFQYLLGSESTADGTLALSDFDVVTLMAVSMEGVLDACDKNKDGKLTMILMDGDDELSCASTIFVDAVRRLIKTGLIKSSQTTANLLGILNTTDPIRYFGKAALIHGCTDSLWLAPFELPALITESATLGSMYSLEASIMDTDDFNLARKDFPLPKPSPSPYKILYSPRQISEGFH